MQMPRNPFTHALAAQQKQLGLWISLSSPFVAEVTAHAGFDWALIDMEHAPNEYFSVLGQLQAFAASGTTAIVRPEWNDPVMVKRLLDLGAPGLLFPMIQSVEEAEQAVAATRYPPRGIRGVSGAMRGNKFGRMTDYVARVEQETTVILQLETQAAIEQADAIAAVDGVSGVFFGPADIAADMGKVGQAMDAEVWELIRATVKRLSDKGVATGTLVLDPDFAAELLNDGFTFVACGTDASLLAKATDSLLATVKGKLT
ncbi:2-dehydro-3-deoxyglucarate aldolase [Sulfitobacter noctilucae]|uniref:HpcH/HpaI aldolase family protein n=1 Tax=Sulfitobacter noctilucae TaxID=1342302 RepID=UPI000469CFF5|nr:HpcH/HpaI aldolase/citrate lyase family protein [Sulfitobacter noctilucae]KIN70487.1 2-dehydro-3-deoxyglucarate aldolase [Sulfitobacter noctilucae]